MLDKNLRSQPFPTSVLREIAIHFPKGEIRFFAWPRLMLLRSQADESQLSAIRGIDPDKVQRYGRQILKLVRDAQRRYEELQKDKDDADGVVPDPNHHNVINLSSDDEYGDDDLFVNGDAAFDRGDNVVPSRFFSSHPPADESPDEFEPSVPAAKGSTFRKRQPNKRPRRRRDGESRPRSRNSKPKPRSRSDGRTTGQPSSSAKGPAAKNSAAMIGMMPL